MTSEAILRKREPLWTRKALLSDILLLTIARSRVQAKLPMGLEELGLNEECIMLGFAACARLSSSEP